MPIARGTIRALSSEDADTTGGLIITNDRWNANMSWVGVSPVRRAVEPYEAPYSVQLGSGLFATTGRIVALAAPPHPHTQLGPVEAALTADELDRCEDALCRFLQIPLLLGAGTRIPPVLGAVTYPLWGEIYDAEPPINGERKRYVVVSPNPWNAASGSATLVRTTSPVKRGSAAFPLIQGTAARACCGEATTVPNTAIRMARRDRSTPMTTTRADMVSIARGFLVTHDLRSAATRAGV